MERPHPLCWIEGEYDHDACREPSGRPCVEKGCNRPAGTLWGPHWCPDHDVERLARIGRSLTEMQQQAAR